jgi:hypothetical protein
MFIANINAAEYKQLGKFHEGLASALTTNDEWVVIDEPPQGKPCGILSVALV